MLLLRTRYYSTRLPELEDEPISLPLDARFMDFDVVLVGGIAQKIAAADEHKPGTLEVGLHYVRVDAMVFFYRRANIIVRVRDMVDDPDDQLPASSMRTRPSGTYSGPSSDAVLLVLPVGVVIIIVKDHEVGIVLREVGGFEGRRDDRNIRVLGRKGLEGLLGLLAIELRRLPDGYMASWPYDRRLNFRPIGVGAKQIEHLHA